MHNLKMRKEIHTPRKLPNFSPNPLKKIMVGPKSDFYVALHCYARPSPQSLLVGNASPHTPCLVPE